MKRTILLFLLGCLTTSVIQAQTSKLQLHIAAGMKTLHATELAHGTSVIPSAAPTLGGGISWMKNRILLGGEFGYTDGKKENDEISTVLTGINFNILGGYKWMLSRRTSLIVQTGFGYGLQHASVSEVKYNGPSALNTAMYHNFIFTVPVSAMIQRTTSGGTFLAARAGYGFSAMKNDWRLMKAASTTTFSAGSDGLYVQLIVGGLLDLKEKDR